MPTRQSSVGPAAVELAAVAGLHLDPWQQWVVTEALGQSSEMYYNDVLGVMVPKSSAYEIGLVVARQNGKGSIMEAIELAWLFLCGVKTIVHSAHEFATSREHFQRIEGLITNTPELKAELGRGGIKWSHGDESITLATGQRLLFKTRTKGAIRGFSPDKIVMDEAMILKQEAVRAMMYAMSARPDAQIMYAGSAGDEESEHFGRVRDRGIKGDDPRLFFAEWSADVCGDLCYDDCEEHDRPDNPLTWAKANPAIGYRIQPVNIASELAADPEGFLQERLSVGRWPVTGEPWGVIGRDTWMSRADEASVPQSPLVFAVDVTPDRAYSCIAVCGGNGEEAPDGSPMAHVEITRDETTRYDHRAGTAWLVPRLVQLVKQWKPAAVVIDKGSQAGSIHDELVMALQVRSLRTEILTPTAREYAQGCGMFYSAVVPRKGNHPTLIHTSQTPLDSAVAGAEKRELADVWAWDKRNATADICPLVASTLAFWGHFKMVNTKRASAPWAIMA